MWNIQKLTVKDQKSPRNVFLKSIGMVGPNRIFNIKCSLQKWCNQLLLSCTFLHFKRNTPNSVLSDDVYADYKCKCINICATWGWYGKCVWTGIRLFIVRFHSGRRVGLKVLISSKLDSKLLTASGFQCRPVVFTHTRTNEIPASPCSEVVKHAVPMGL